MQVALSCACTASNLRVVESLPKAVKCQEEQGRGVKRWHHLARCKGNTVPLTMQEYCSVKLSANLQSGGGNTFEEEKPSLEVGLHSKTAAFRLKLGSKCCGRAPTCEKRTAQSPLHNAYAQCTT